MGLFYKLDSKNLIVGIVQADALDSTLRAIGESTPSVYSIGKMIYDDKLVRLVPMKSRILTKLGFNNRFTIPELAAIKVAALTDPVLQVLQEKSTMADNINLDDPSIPQGLDYLISKGLLAPERKAQILV